ncbi:MAG: hypothetical protein JNM43_28235 [Planctomycetaceae bacterium]|nr:hypothetical protein [Planctomycetaceae bacterium]
MTHPHCYRCLQTVPSAAVYCPRCSFPRQFSSSPLMVGSEWTAGADEFAVRIRPQDLKAWLLKGINVDESQTGLLFENGRFEHELLPGRQKIESLPERLRRYVTGETAAAVLIRRGLFPISVLGAGQTAAGDEIRFDVEVGLQLGDRNAFYIHFMQNADRVTSGDLMQRFAATIRNAVFATIRSCDGSELLNPHPELQQRLIDGVTDALTPIAARFGIAVGYVSPPQFSNSTLAEFQAERSRMTRSLRDEKLQLQYQEDKDKIEMRRFQVARLLSDAKLKAAEEEAERTNSYDAFKARLRHEQQLMQMQLTDQMEVRVDEFAARRRDRTEKNEDHISLRTHLLARADLERQEELSNLKFQFRKQSLKQQLEIDDISRAHQLKVAQEEHDAELSQLDKTQIGQIARWNRIRDARRQDRLAETELQVKTMQITSEAERARLARDFDENHRQRAVAFDQTIQEGHANLGLEAARQEKLSAVQAIHLTRLTEIESMLQEQVLNSEKAKHSLAEETREREHRRRMEELQVLKDSPEMIQLLELAKLSVHQPVMAAAFARAMDAHIAKGMPAEQFEQFAASQSPELARVLLEKYRLQSEVQRSSQQAASDFAQRLMESERNGLERIITELKSSQAITREQWSDILERLQSSGTKGQELLREVGVANATRSEKAVPVVDHRLVEKLVDRIGDLLR